MLGVSSVLLLLAAVLFSWLKVGIGILVVLGLCLVFAYEVWYGKVADVVGLQKKE